MSTSLEQRSAAGQLTVCAGYPFHNRLMRIERTPVETTTNKPRHTTRVRDRWRSQRTGSGASALPNAKFQLLEVLPLRKVRVPAVAARNSTISTTEPPTHTPRAYALLGDEAGHVRYSDTSLGRGGIQSIERVHGECKVRAIWFYEDKGEQEVEATRAQPNCTPGLQRYINCTDLVQAACRIAHRTRETPGATDAGAQATYRPQRRHSCRARSARSGPLATRFPRACG